MFYRLDKEERNLINNTKVTGCLLGGAIGDALGYPIEFTDYEGIKQRFGKDGITHLEIPEGKNLTEISDDTQMTLFTVEGLLWAKHRQDEVGVADIASRCFYSYQRWLHTQGYELAEESYRWILNDERLEIKSPLLSVKDLYAKRAPGNTCIASLRRAVNQDYGTIQTPINNSKGCGGVMRVAPAGLCYASSARKAFEIGIELAAITHTHPTGYLAAGAFAAIIAHLTKGNSIEGAVELAINILLRFAGAEETINALRKALVLASEHQPSVQHIEELGKGWVAEEALAIGVYAACCYPDDFVQAVRLAVNHGGDSDSTGSICGNIVGVCVGKEGIPTDWIQKLECHDVIESMSNALVQNFYK